jgi:PEGA domain
MMRDQSGVPSLGIATVDPVEQAPDSQPAVENPPLKSGLARDGDHHEEWSREQDPLLTWVAEKPLNTRQRLGAPGLTRGLTRPQLWQLAGVIAVLTVVTEYLVWTHYAQRAQANPAAVTSNTGTATINSRPEGLIVVIDDEVRGRTPLKLTLPIGTHTLQIQAGETRSIPLTIDAGTSVSQYIDVGTTAAPPSSGRLVITSDPPGSSVRVDGSVAGNTPLTLPVLSVGEHRVIVGSGDAAIARTITILPGETASIVAAVSQPSMTAGWVSFTTPVEMQVFEDGSLLGTTRTDRLMLPTGTHQLELVNTLLEFRKTASVRIAAGKTATAVVTIPNGSVSVNALPWADVEIDGRAIGTTPLANISLPIGSHEVVWKHPQLGERRQTIVITAASPARVGMDFNR